MTKAKAAGENMVMVEVEQDNKKLMKKFIDLPWEIYASSSTKKDHPHWVPPLKLGMQDLLNPQHPFYQEAEIKLWLLFQGDQAIGRIAAIINHAHNSFHQEECGFFGFFECIDQHHACHLLFSTAEKYLQEKGMKIFRGPVNPSTNYESGLLVDTQHPDDEGFSDPPQIMLTYNPRYYERLIIEEGFTKCMDLLAFKIDTSTPLPQKIQNIAERLKSSHQITCRTLSKKNWRSEVKIIRDIYNHAWEKNWGFIPMSDAEFLHMAKSLKPFCVEDLSLVIELQGKPVGLIMAIPDYNQIIQHIPDGKLFPWGLIKLLTGSKKINRARLISLGIKKEYRALGLSTLFYHEIREQFAKLRQYKELEMSWILENNHHMIKPLKLMGGRHYKTYRLFEKLLSPSH